MHVAPRHNDYSLLKPKKSFPRILDFSYETQTGCREGMKSSPQSNGDSGT
jgi:hypothetical protein